MDILHAVFLALIQGITEFLPISSSAHLILPKELFGWEDQGLAFDVAVHVGTLSAVILYFRKDIVNLIAGWFGSITGKQSENGSLAWCIIIATVPAGLFGLLLGDFIEEHLRSVSVIATTTVVFGLLLWFADAKHTETKQLAQMTFFIALVIGLAQALAMIPGTSRSGITITAALLLGFGRSDAARFSFLLSIPIITLSGGYMGLKLLEESNVNWQEIGVGVLVSAISAYICIHYFLSFINKIGMLPFVIYRLLLGAGLFALVWFA
ncbi:undecaprenyl-diphosphate phosphatase [Saccharophagus degradans]|uniref:undecaprenyl-diphosphate phosphatase n=1 Tax=Saccharophagus degradans TaxID=86304 RepID=UPI00247802E3|nr:undecaprenyl-diphosphate phosphatase [Saccharophagus degradans]WGP00274.1 undecaprenyl-diphosphate phosphatase [Saccharophagus degradans]